MKPTEAQRGNWPNGFEPRFIDVTRGHATVIATGERVEFVMTHDGVPFPFYSGLRLWCAEELWDIVFEGDELIVIEPTLGE